MPHARLAASAAERWMNCAGSVARSEERGSGSGGGSYFARLGTAAHLVASETLKSRSGDASTFLGFDVAMKDGDAVHVGMPDDDDDYSQFPDHDELIRVDQEMVDSVQVFIDFCEELRAGAPPGTVEYVEQYLDMTWLHPLFGGTGDFIQVRPFDYVDVVDFKNGSGVIVEVRDNPQLMKYGVGALHDHPDAEGVRITIVQPRASHPDGPVRSIAYTRDELGEFARQLREAADLTQVPNAPLRAGDWCKFCPAAYDCPELASRVMEEAGADFAEMPFELPSENAAPSDTNEELSAKLKWVSIIDAWCRTIEGFAQRELEAGRPVPGYKLVRKKGKRGWNDGVDADTIARALRAAGLKVKKADVQTEPKLKSPAQAEKLGAKKITKAAIAELCGMRSSGLTVATADDPREAVDPSEAAASDFADEAQEDDE